ncbi:site-specific DNA-methyltransferase [Rhizobium leguminosarum]|uniref:site-specific DNA-methyltransferase n=1 Tax=Rhizobium leguminosarum TaxID=384 RepID=UPI00103227D8|nr:site-specific DNA-methyltransferase [Rhizobium leguminosarum]TAZ15416.1 site-specific DNA-methyltransferase [Rhizobium leguminosarum]
MKKLELNAPETKSADIVFGNLSALQSLFPDAFREGKIDFDVLKQLLGAAVDDQDEKYGLNWHGKRKARQIALTPSVGTLLPCPQESVDWEISRNLMIEGDNLEVLKLLQKSYAGNVNFIYIDPPYNTGRDFIYPDDFRDNIKNYLSITGQIDSRGSKSTTNSESSGRFHTAWLNMMYPRLKLAHRLLSGDGSIAISVDDGELDNVRIIMSEIFGEENFLAQIIWRKRSTPPNDKIIGANHDYIVLYSKSIDSVRLNLRERSEEQVARYRNPDQHPKGPWAPGDLMANVKGGRYVASLHFPIINPNNGEEHLPGTNGNWRFSKETIDRLLQSDEIYFGEDGLGKPKLKRFLADVKDGVTYPTIWDFVPLNTSGSNEMKEIFGDATIFESPKPVGLIEELLRLGTDRNSTCLDFFAGSSTLAHATMSLNAKDQGSRRFVCVQLPEAVPSGSEAEKRGFSTIAELSKERIRRAGDKIRRAVPTQTEYTGFRVFKLAQSNIRAWEPLPSDLEGTLLANAEHIVPGRSEQDVLYELLLKLGLDLCVPIETQQITGKTVHAIGGGALITCLAGGLTKDVVESLSAGIVAWWKQLAPAVETRVVFKDSGFANDVAKTNMAAILNQNGILDVRSL